MSNGCVIEIQGDAVGILVREGRSYKFFAAMQAFNVLEGRMFSTPRHAERAAHEILRRKPGALQRHRNRRYPAGG